jgi:Protein of unknown function (DUF3108)
MHAFFSDISLKRLLLAVVASVLLHAVLLGNLRIPLPKLLDKPKVVEIRLVNSQMKPAPAKAEPAAEKPLEPAPTQQEIAPEITPELFPKPITEIVTQTTAPLPEPAPVVAPTLDSDLQVNAEMEKPSVAILPDNPEAVVEQEEGDVMPHLRKNNNIGISKPLSTEEESAPQANTNEPANPQAYTFVLTEFDVFRNQIKSRAGTTKIEFRRLGEQYQLTSQIEAVGLASLVYPKLTQTSGGLVTGKGLMPTQYIYDFGGKADKSSQVDFDWSNRKAILRSAKGDKVVEITEGTQDFLSFMYQFMYVPPLNNMQIVMTNGKKIDTYDYLFLGEEILNLKFGQIKTFHIGRDSVKSDEKTELWLAQDYQFLPVKIRKTEKDGSVIEQVATSISTQEAIDTPNKNPTALAPIELTPTELTPIETRK